MDNKQCIRCGTRNEENSPRCWYCHAMFPVMYSCSEPQAAFNGKNRLGPVRPKETDDGSFRGSSHACCFRSTPRPETR